MTQVARGLDPNGLLLFDVVVNGVVPESLADADLQVQVLEGGPGMRGHGTPHPQRSLSRWPTLLPDIAAGAGVWPVLGLRAEPVGRLGRPLRDRCPSHSINRNAKRW